MAGELGLLGGVLGSQCLSLSALVALGLGAGIGVLNFDLDACSPAVGRFLYFIALPRMLPWGGPAERLLLLFALADINPPILGVFPNWEGGILWIEKLELLVVFPSSVT